ncbi:MAG: hypothetical protein HYX66_09995 [Ignavibacteria bacterium]|nr:hypothetical protein [Ignavibacteria bacterium]
MRVRMLTLCLVFLVAYWSNAIAQFIGLTAVFPTNRSTGIDPDASLVIRSPAPIAPESITFGYPDSDQFGNTPKTPTITLIPSALKDKSFAVQRREMVIGRYVLQDIRTIRFEHGRLAPSTSYMVVVSNVGIIGGAILPSLEFEFTTRDDVLRVKSCILDSVQQINCSQPINVAFTGSIRNVMPDPTQLLVVESAEDHVGNVWTRKPVIPEISPDGKSVRLSPVGGWMPGSALRLRCQLSLVTGSIDDDRLYTTVVRRAGQLSINVVATDGRTIPDWVASQFEDLNQVAIANAAIDLSAPLTLGDRWRFVRWESPDINISSGPSVKVTFPCNLIRANQIIRAIVERVDSIAFAVNVDSGGIVNVYNDAGLIVKTIDISDTIFITDDLRQPILMAVPSSGYTFTQWAAPSGTFNGSTSAAAIIGTAIQNQLGTNWNTGSIPGFNPKFKNGDPLSETYKLRAVLEDVDYSKLFDVNESVRFTTAQTFESGSADIETICVNAERCWEIVGYAISNTQTMNYIEGVQSLCIDAQLTKPENVITIYAQRKPIYLRVEKVLLKSDDPDDIILKKTIAGESYVKVDLRSLDNAGLLTWIPYPSVTCFDNGIPFSTYQFACGDEIRIRTKGTDIRAEVWKYFAEKELYVTPSYSETVAGENIYTMVIDQDLAYFDAKDCMKNSYDAPEIRVRACFLQKFGVASIGLTVRTVKNENREESKFEERWYDPLLYRDLASDEPRGSHQIEYVPFHGTRVRVEFTLPIDVQTIYSGGMKARSYGNMLVTNPRERNLDFEVASFDDEHINFEARNGTGLNTVVFDINDPTTSPRRQALHGGIIDVFCESSLKSLSGMPLETRALFILDRMELPGYSLSLKSINFAYDGDWDFWPFENYGEIYLAMYGGDMAAHKALMTESAFQRIPDCREQQGTVPDECTIEHSDKHNPLDLGNHLLWIQPYWMDLKDYVWFYGAAYDEDCKDERDCWVNRMAEVIYKVRDRADQYKSTDRKVNLDWPTIIPDLIAVGAEFLGTLLTPDEQDYYLGQVTILEGSATWWGMNRSTVPIIYAEHPNVRMTLEGRFYVTKAVLR